MRARPREEEGGESMAQGRGGREHGPGKRRERAWPREEEGGESMAQGRGGR